MKLKPQYQFKKKTSFHNYIEWNKKIEVQFKKKILMIKVLNSNKIQKLIF